MREQGPQKHMAYRMDTGDSLFLMKPDMVFLDEAQNPVALADAKWKLLNEKGRGLGISQGDLYQMSAYAMRYKIDRLAMLYPRQVNLTSPLFLRLQGGSIIIEIIPVDVTPGGEVDRSFLDGGPNEGSPWP